MAITQTVEIPADRRLIIDVPREILDGRVVLTFALAANVAGNDMDGKWVNPLLGLANKKGAKLTLERFMEMQREEIELENENHRRLWESK